MTAFFYFGVQSYTHVEGAASTELCGGYHTPQSFALPGQRTYLYRARRVLVAFRSINRAVVALCMPAEVGQPTVPHPGQDGVHVAPGEPAEPPLCIVQCRPGTARIVRPQKVAFNHRPSFGGCWLEAPRCVSSQIHGRLARAGKRPAQERVAATEGVPEIVGAQDHPLLVVRCARCCRPLALPGPCMVWVALCVGGTPLGHVFGSAFLHPDETAVSGRQDVPLCPAVDPGIGRQLPERPTRAPTHRP